MHTFLTSWLPNIVCTVSGCVVSWAIGYSQGSVSRRTLANLLHLQARAPSKCPGVARKGKTGGRRAARRSPELAGVRSLPYRLAHLMAATIDREPVKPTSLFSSHGEVRARRGHCGGVDVPERVRVERLLSDERRLVFAEPRSELGTLSSQPERCRTSRPKRRQPL
jgi:hypothetical protein